MIAVGGWGLDRSRRVARAPLSGAVVAGDDLPVQAEILDDPAECIRPLHRVDELLEPRNAGDPPVAEGRQVFDRLRDERGLVMPDGRQCAALERAADDDGRKTELGELVHPRVDDPEVDHEHAVDAPLAPPAPVDGDLLVEARHELQHQSDRARGELGLDAHDECHEERLEREHVGRACEDEAAGMRPGRGQRAGRPVRVPAEVPCDAEDPLPGVLGDAGLSVQRVRYGALRDTGPLRDVADGDPLT